jgi:hypothetical protein
VTQLVRALAKRFNVSASIIQDQQVEWAVEKGVAFAEEWARTASTKPLGNVKADKALDVVQKLLETDAVQEYGVDALRDLIKAKVAQLNVEKPAA